MSSTSPYRALTKLALTSEELSQWMDKWVSPYAPYVAGGGAALAAAGVLGSHLQRAWHPDLVVRDFSSKKEKYKPAVPSIWPALSIPASVAAHAVLHEKLPKQLRRLAALPIAASAFWNYARSDPINRIRSADGTLKPMPKTPISNAAGFTGAGALVLGLAAMLASKELRAHRAHADGSGATTPVVTNTALGPVTFKGRLSDLLAPPKSYYRYGTIPRISGFNTLLPMAPTTLPAGTPAALYPTPYP